MEKIVSQGAEAQIILNKDYIIKKRIPKLYRIKEIDERLRKQRTKGEAKLLEKAQKIIFVPKILAKEEFSLKMEYIQGDKLSEKLNDYPIKSQLQIMKNLGKSLADLHNINIIHGDLTTSNVIFSNKKIYIIDFGLGFISERIEDKAVDLHLIRQALEAKHFENWKKLFKSLLRGYNPKEKTRIITQLKKVESRGRHKH